MPPAPSSTLLSSACKGAAVWFGEYCSPPATGAYPQFEATLVTSYKNANGIILGMQPALTSAVALRHSMRARHSPIAPTLGSTGTSAVKHCMMIQACAMLNNSEAATHLSSTCLQARLTSWSCPAQQQASTPTAM